MAQPTVSPRRRTTAAAVPPEAPSRRSGFLEQELKARGVAEVIVVLRPAAAPAVGAAAGARFATRAESATAAADLSQYFVTGDPRAQETAIARASATSRGSRLSVRAAARAEAAATPPPPRTFDNLGVMLGTVTREGLEALEADRKVELVAGAPQISLVRPTSTSAASMTDSFTWGVNRLKAPALWRKGFSGGGIIVAHLDTGVDGRHAALRSAVTHFAEFDLLGFEISPPPAARDSGDHGTHTAGTIAGRPVRKRHIGVAPEAQIASALVIEGGDAVARVLGGMNWAVGIGARVLSMSLGFRGWWEDFIAITDILRFRGILPVIAAGNEGSGSTRSPGNYSAALSVGATDSRDIVAAFSSSQLFDRPDDAIVPDLVGPGVDVISARPGGGYQSMNGTSMATPHIAGVAALLLSAFPAATVDQVETSIFNSCVRPVSMDPQRGGRGIPDATRALAELSAMLA